MSLGAPFPQSSAGEKPPVRSGQLVDEQWRPVAVGRADDMVAVRWNVRVGHDAGRPVRRRRLRHGMELHGAESVGPS